MVDTPFFVGREHIWFKCNCHRTGCMFCDGGLSACDVCGGFEGSLLPECPGRRLTEAEHDANYEHYCNSTGPFVGKGLRRG